MAREPENRLPGARGARTMNPLWRLLSYVRPYLALLLLSVLLMAVAGVSQALIPVLIGPVLGRVLRPEVADTPIELVKLPWGETLYLNQFLPKDIHNVWVMVAVAILAIFLLKGIGEYFGQYFITYVGLSAVMDMRQRSFDKLLRMDAQFYESNPTALLMSAVMNDLDKIQVATSSILADWLRQSFTAAGLLYVLFSRDWRLALVSLTVIPFVLIPTARIGKRIRRVTRRAQDDTAELNQILQEALAGQQVVKTFGMEKHASSAFRDAASRLMKSNLRYTRQQAAVTPLIEIFGAATVVALLWYARSMILLGRMSDVQFTTFVFALFMLYQPVKRLTGIYTIFQQAFGASHRVFEYLDREETVRERPGAITLAGFEKAVAFENASFRYPNAPDGFLLDGLNLEVRRGEVVALVGPSGAGKTSIANLVPRFYDVIAGAVRLDGHDVRDLTLASLRAQIGIVSQDTFLFNDTVANNIRHGRPSATDEEIKAAARNALADEFILAMPQGYDTVIGERGTKLSGGQRQRLAIARALLKNAPLLILDEATSQLDTESESLVQVALSNLMRGRTVIVIAHRLSTIRKADRIVVLDSGRVTEIGSHDELVGQGGIYQRLHELQYL